MDEYEKMLKDALNTPQPITHEDMAPHERMLERAIIAMADFLSLSNEELEKALERLTIHVHQEFAKQRKEKGDKPGV